MKVTGRNGADLDEAWNEAQRAYPGICVPGFPNFFMIGGPSSPIGNFSFLMTAETQMGYILELVKHIAAAEGVEIHPRVEAMDRLYDAIARRMPGTIWATGCKSSYMDRNGQIALWPWSYERFQEQLREPDMEDFHPFLVPHS